MSHMMPLTERLETIRNGHIEESKERQNEQIKRMQDLSHDLYSLSLEMRTEFDKLNAEVGGLQRELHLASRRNHTLLTKLMVHEPWRQPDDVPW